MKNLIESLIANYFCLKLTINEKFKEIKEVDNRLCLKIIRDKIFEEPCKMDKVVEYINYAFPKAKNILQISMYSMCSRKDKKYNILIDGNANYSLHRWSTLRKDQTLTMTIPKNVRKYELEEFKKLCKKFLKCKVNFLPITYGKSAYHNRHIVPISVQYELGGVEKLREKYDVIVSIFCQIKNCDVYFFDISKVLDYERPYIDEFITYQQECDVVFGPNYNQISLLPQVVYDWPLLNIKILDKFEEYYEKNIPEIEEIRKLSEKYDGLVFFPFRVTDKAYQFETIHKFCQETNKLMVITDPNDNISDELSHIYKVKYKNRKEFFINFITSDLDFKIYCTEDIFKTIHITIFEILYFCPEKYVFWPLRNNEEVNRIYIERARGRLYAG